jgi:hypothetical protein
MNITITGTPANVGHDETISAIDYYATKLISKKLRSGLDIHIHFDYKLQGQGLCGLCEWMDQNHRPKEFRLTIKANMTKRKTLITLAHEMVHVKQYACGTMKELLTNAGLSKRMVRWQDKYVDTHKINYWDQPWEIEAHGRELGLYVRYLDSIGDDSDIED